MSTSNDVLAGDLVLFSGLFYRDDLIEMISEWKRGVVTRVVDGPHDSLHASVLCEGEIVQVPLSQKATEVLVVMREQIEKKEK